MEALKKQGLVSMYDSHGKQYLQMSTWHKHQQKRAKYSKYPDPGQGMQSFDNNRNQMQSISPEKRETRNEKRYSDVEFKILSHWNSKEIVSHQETDTMQNSIQAALKKYSEEEIIKAIDRYATILKDNQYYFSYVWRLDKFLKQSNGLPDFLEDGQKWINYKKDHPDPQEKYAKVKT